MKKRQVLVTGAAGFVGRALSLGFADLGWEVVGLDCAFDEGWEHEGMRHSIAELAEGVPSDVPEVDLVIHSAWVTTDPEKLGITTKEYIDLNIGPLLTMLEYAKHISPSAFVFLSSSGVFAATDADEGLKDTYLPKCTSPYAAAKREGEALTLSSALDSKTEVHVVRLGYLFGPGEVARPSRVDVSCVASWLAAARQGKALEVRSDDPLREWTFTSDLAVALEQVVDGPSVGHAVHMGSTHVSRDSAVAALIASEFPGTESVTVSAEGLVKPPMIPSDIPALRDFVWTDPNTGLRTLLAAEVMG